MFVPIKIVDLINHSLDVEEKKIVDDISTIRFRQTSDDDDSIDQSEMDVADITHLLTSKSVQR